MRANLWLMTGAAVLALLVGTAVAAGQPPDGGKGGKEKDPKALPDEEREILKEIREAYKAPFEVHEDVLKVELNDETEILRVTLRDGAQDGGSLARTLITEGFTLKMLKEEEVNLEHVFMGITKGITN